MRKATLYYSNVHPHSILAINWVGSLLLTHANLEDKGRLASYNTKWCTANSVRISTIACTLPCKNSTHFLGTIPMSLLPAKSIRLGLARQNLQTPFCMAGYYNQACLLIKQTRRENGLSDTTFLGNHSRWKQQQAQA